MRSEPLLSCENLLSANSPLHMAARLRGFLRNMKRFLPLAMLLVLTACSTTLTNLTPRTAQRNPNGLYPVEVMWDSQQANIKKETIKGYVVVGEDAYPMHRSPMLTNRW